MTSEGLPTDEEVAAMAARIGLPVPADQLPGLGAGVRRIRNMAQACRDLVDADVTPDFVFRPLRRTRGGD